MSDDVVTRLNLIAPIHEGRKGHDCIAEAADEIERLRGLMKAFVYQWEQDEIGNGNGTDYFNAVHTMRMEVKKYD